MSNSWMYFFVALSLDSADVFLCGVSLDSADVFLCGVVPRLCMLHVYVYG